jgi:hypothetical protein
MPRDKQLKISSETIYLYAPLAHRLGLYTLKSELEDLAMKYMEPATYKFIAQQLNEKKAERENFIKDFISPIKEILNEQGLKADLYGRPKSIHSIWTKMRKKNIPFDELDELSSPSSSPSSSELAFELLELSLLPRFLALRASRRASRSAFAASRFAACRSAIAVTSASFLSFAAPSIPSWVATSFNFGRVIADNSGLLERTGVTSGVSVISVFSVMA